MSSKMPMIKQIGWASIIPHLLLLGIIIFIYYIIRVDEYLLFGFFTYLLISIIVRNLIAKYHRKGIQNMQKRNFIDAINCFERSYEFFNHHNWLDKYRYIFLLSSSKISYKEMALCNIAFCYGQIGNGEKSECYYKLTLKEFPDSLLAKSSLNMINSIKNNM
jgi:tetratricopeptide (TPR) repeat protein